VLTALPFSCCDLVQCATLMSSERFLGCLIICIDAIGEEGKNSWGEPKCQFKLCCLHARHLQILVYGRCYKKVNIWMCSAEWDVQILHCGGL
jgi:hypothetical protein